MSELILNPEQQRAVTTTEGPVLIIAGAGSGKTRVITQRILQLLRQAVPQKAILALTFTNKAAKEMTERVSEGLSRKARDLQTSTFHAFGARLLREHATRLGYRSNFSIYDMHDQGRVLRETAREMSFDLSADSVSGILDRFSRMYTGRTAPGDEPGRLIALHEHFRDHLRVYNAVTFDDLIVLPARLLGEHGDLREELQERFRYVMVDEFQDTSRGQYELLRLLVGPHRNIACVGDDDQSIYSWRGASVENIAAFERDYPDRALITLEQNYRSRQHILSAANRVIANNSARKPKVLRGRGDSDTRLVLLSAETDRDEARQIVELARDIAAREGIRFDDMAILLRTNAIARRFEEALLEHNLPYTISGGSSFFDRPEVRDCSSWLRVLANPDDDVAYLRIINTPRRGVGKRSLELIGGWTTARGSSIHGALAEMLGMPDGAGLPRQSQQSLSELTEVLDSYRGRVRKGRGMAEQFSALLADLGYETWVREEFVDRPEIAEWRMKNVKTFIRILREYASDQDNPDPDIFGFLNRITLSSRETAEAKGGAINLMTIHSSKGLEFRVVFIAGVEEDIIPHARSIAESSLEPEAALEEERRLFYVAVTRAREQLYLSSARLRSMLRDTREMVPSRFLAEIGEDLLEAREEQPVLEQQAEDYFGAIRRRIGGE